MRRAVTWVIHGRPASPLGRRNREAVCGCDRKWRTDFAELCCCFGEPDWAGREEIGWRWAGGDACGSRTCGAAERHPIVGTHGSEEQERNRANPGFPAFLFSRFSLSGPCFHPSRRDSAPVSPMPTQRLRGMTSEGILPCCFKPMSEGARIGWRAISCVSWKPHRDDDETACLRVLRTRTTSAHPGQCGGSQAFSRRKLRASSRLFAWVLKGRLAGQNLRTGEKWMATWCFLCRCSGSRCLE